MKYIVCWHDWCGDYRSGNTVSTAGSNEFETEEALREWYNDLPTYVKCWNIQAFAVHHKIELKRVVKEKQ